MIQSYHKLFWRVLMCVSLMGISTTSWAQITTFPYFSDFETDNGGWTSQVISGFYNNWTWTSPANPLINTAASGTKCWILGNSAVVFPPLEPYYYGPDERSAAVSPEFDFSNLTNPGIKMNIWWESEYSVDGTVLQSSIDGGTTWQTVGNYLDATNWYNDSSISAMPGGGVVGWTGDTATSQTGSGGWVEAQHPLWGLGGESSVRLRFAFASDGGQDSAVSVFDGFAFDDVIVAEMPNIDLGNDTILCFADSLVLNACDPGVVEYKWNTSPLDTLCNLVAVSSARYIVTTIDTLGFIVRDTIKVTVSSTYVNLGPDQIICPGDTVTLNAFNQNASYLWSPTGDTISAIKVTETGQYKVTAIDNFNCIESDSINVVVDYVPPVDLGPDTVLCSGQSILLDAGSGNPGTTYEWDPITATTQTVFISSPGTYSVLVTSQANCTETDTLTVGVGLTPLIDLGDDRIFCDSITLDATNSGASFLWDNGDTTQTRTVLTSGTYIVQVTSPSGCYSSDTVALTYGTGTPFSLGADQILCGGDPITLDMGISGQQYWWSTGETSQTINVDFTGRIIARLTNPQGCEYRDTINIGRSNLVVDLGDDVSICDGDSILLSAQPGASTYQWSTGETSKDIYADQDGDYHVTLSDTLGCEVSDTVNVNVTASPTPDFDTSGDLVLYNNITFNDQSSTGVSSWLWNFGDGNTSTQQNPTHAYVATDTFNVCLTVSDGVCSRTTCKPIFIDLFSGIYGYHPGIDLKAYPNPATDVVNLELDLPVIAPVEVSITDLQGRTLISESWGEGQTFTRTLSVENLNAGIYILMIEVGEQPLYLKLRTE